MVSRTHLQALYLLFRPPRKHFLSLNACQNSTHLSKSSWKVTSFHPLFHLHIAEAFMEQFLCARHSFGCWMRPCSGCLSCAPMTFYTKLCSTASHTAGSSFLSPTICLPHKTELPQDGITPYTSLLSTQPSKSLITVYWLLTNNEEHEEKLFGVSVCTPVSSWLLSLTPNTLSALMAVATQLSQSSYSDCCLAPSTWSLLLPALLNCDAWYFIK